MSRGDQFAPYSRFDVLLDFAEERAGSLHALWIITFALIGFNGPDILDEAKRADEEEGLCG